MDTHRVKHTDTDRQRDTQTHIARRTNRDTYTKTLMYIDPQSVMDRHIYLGKHTQRDIHVTGRVKIRERE